MNNYNTFFKEDVVSLLSEPQCYGVVESTGYDTSDSEEEEEEDFEEEENNIHVWWVDSLEERKENPNLLKVVDRALLHGDIVMKKSDPSGQSGTVINVTELLDLQFPPVEGVKQLIKGVPSNLVKRIHPFEYGTLVVKGDWLGKIVECILDVQVTFPDGSICLIEKANPKNLALDIDFEIDEEYFDQSLYFPSQRVKVKPSLLKKCKWIKGVYKHQNKGTITLVEPSKVDVEWIRTKLADKEVMQPKNFCNPEDLKILQYFSYCHFQIGERVISPPKIKKNWKNYSEDEFTNNFSKINITNQDFNDKSSTDTQIDDLSIDLVSNCSVINCTQTFVDVCWQDSTITKNIPSIELLPVNNLLDEDFHPQDFVLEKGNLETQIYGVIKKVDSKERTCTVTWKSIKDPNQNQDEEVSNYSIVNHLDWTYQLSDVVLRLPKENQTEVEPWVGEVTQIEDGKLFVNWVDNSTSWELPNELLRIDIEDEYSEDEYSEDEYSEDEYSEDSEDDQESLSENVQPTFLEKPSIAWWQEKEPDFQNMKLNVSTPITRQSDESYQPILNSNNSNESQTNRKSFLPFDVIEEATQSHFLDKEVRRGSTELISSILHEWDLLKVNLPENVFVRVYENRIDLMKILIFAPKDTPYKDCPFVFDILIPEDYPNQPPSIHFCSYCDQLNPTLFTDGHVCLSLINTWDGKGVEVWSKDSSNILQVVISLQGLILGSSEPYFLESSHEKLKGTPYGDKISKLYNESACLLALQSIINTLANPPLDFKHILDKFYKENEKEILRSVEVYLDKDNNTSEAKQKLFITDPSLGFKKSLEKLFPKLKKSIEDYLSK